MARSRLTVLLVVALGALASSVSAGPMNTTNITNGSKYPLLGLELMSFEAGSKTPSARAPVFLDQPLPGGRTTSVTFEVDAALMARGGQQQLRWYWTADRACWGYLIVSPKGGNGGTNTGDHVCQGRTTPAAPDIPLPARMEAAAAIARRGDVPGAIFETNSMMAEFPGLANLLHLRGQLYLQLGYPEAAEEDFRAETGIEAGHAFHDQAQIHYARGEGMEAILSLSAAIRDDPENIQYLTDRAHLYCMARAYDEMREDELVIAALGGPAQLPRMAGCEPMESGW